jgi:hypothetical protein
VASLGVRLMATKAQLQATLAIVRADRDEWKARALECEAGPLPSPAPSYPHFNDGTLSGFTLGWGGEIPAVVDAAGRPGKCGLFSLSDGEGRSEVVLGEGSDKEVAIGSTVTLALGLYIRRMDNWGASGGHNIIYQFQGGGGNPPTSPRVALQLLDLDGPGLYAHGAGGIGWGVKLAPLETGRWHDLKVTVRCAIDTTGEFHVDLDGRRVYDRAGWPTLRSDHLWGYQKFGLYRNPDTVRGVGEVLVDA